MLRALLKAHKRRIVALSERLQAASIRAAAKEQGLDGLMERLRAIVPNVSAQNTTYSIDSEALELRVRALHAFQIRLALKAVDRVLADSPASGERPFTVADIGDSSGTHLLYLDALLGLDPRFKERGFESVSVNLDPVAVEKIRARGLKAVLCPAERLHEKDVAASLFMALETIEHLHDPCSFLDTVSREARCGHFLVTVPYRRQSRVGFQYIRNGQQTPTTPENTHIFELSPEDWKLLFRHSGWEIIEEEIFLQYPRFSIWTATRPAWRSFDFEGFCGFLLKRDRRWAELYRAG